MGRKLSLAAASAFVLLLALTALRTHADGAKAYAVGQKVADFTVKDENGRAVKLSQYRGKIIILNFYASW